MNSLFEAIGIVLIAAFIISWFVRSFISYKNREIPVMDSTHDQVVVKVRYGNDQKVLCEPKEAHDAVLKYGATLVGTAVNLQPITPYRWEVRYRRFKDGSTEDDRSVDKLGYPSFEALSERRGGYNKEATMYINAATITSISAPFSIQVWD